MKRRTVLVTGGTGFVGGYLSDHLSRKGWNVRIPVRHPARVSLSLEREHLEVVPTGDLATFADWKRLVCGVDAIVHLVARTHVVDEFGSAAIQAYRTTNVDITRRLANAARQAGVSRFIYLSSIKAVGNSSDYPLDEMSDCAPNDSYGITKLEAENTVVDQLAGSECSYTIIRPPLVYGPGVQGNFLRLLRVVQQGLPMPRVNNQRSMVHVENLVDLISECLQHVVAREQVFHVADPQPISTTTLIQNMARGMRRAPRLLPVPQGFLTHMARVIRRREQVRRLTDSLIVSTAKVTDLLKWKAALSTAEGVRQTSAVFASEPWSEKQPARYRPPAANRAA